jgi:4-alpha-glucanotransferase
MENFFKILDSKIFDKNVRNPVNGEVKRYFSFYIKYKTPHNNKPKYKQSEFTFISKEDAEKAMQEFFKMEKEKLSDVLINRTLSQDFENKKSQETQDELMSDEEVAQAFADMKRRVRGESFSEYFRSLPS